MKPLIADPIVEKAVREELATCLIALAPEGELTNADLAKLTGADLAGTQTTDAGLKEVAKLQKLTKLYLDDTEITDACLGDIAKMQQLTVLSLERTKITVKNAAELRKALPKCEIDYSYKKD